MAEGVSVEGGGRLRPFLLLIFELGAVGRDAVLSGSYHNARLSSKIRPTLEQTTSNAQQHAARSRLHSVRLPTPSSLGRSTALNTQSLLARIS
jgi:hypothetical protein